ncbi:MAG: hypothetical protein JWN41_559, partial [Thermoleophilia bacterium]|nr:hypothetical protein [Thermoleophilia bacterium]
MNLRGSDVQCGARDLRRHVSRREASQWQKLHPIAITDASTDANVKATFDFDSYGAELTGPVSFTSGAVKEHTQSRYTYTGMRKSDVGDTTSHHARDYNAT